MLIFFFVIYSDPDAGKLKEFHHWLVGNIPGVDVSMGETLTAYVGSATPPKTGNYLINILYNRDIYSNLKVYLQITSQYFLGLHRYVFLVYKQPSKLVFDEQHINNK